MLRLLDGVMKRIPYIILFAFTFLFFQNCGKMNAERRGLVRNSLVTQNINLLEPELSEDVKDPLGDKTDLPKKKDILPKDPLDEKSDIVIINGDGYETVKLTEEERNKIVTKVYKYSPYGGVSKHLPIFKYSDLVTKARRYKEKFPNEEVVVKIALYKVAKNVIVGFNPNAVNSYGWVGNHDFGGTNSEKFIYSLKRAHRAGVKLQFLYHNPGSDYGVSLYLNNGLTQGTHFKKVKWGSAASAQMHNKFVTVNKALGKNGILRDIVYVSTSNIDSFTWATPRNKLAQSGVVIYNHPRLYEAYNRYHDVLWKHADNTNIEDFRTEVRGLHDEKKLNYSDEDFSAFFFPMKDIESAWDPLYNPLARLTDKLAIPGSLKNYVKVNSYTLESSLGKDPFATMFNKKILDNKSSVHFRSVIHKANQSRGGSVINVFDGQKTGIHAMTHNKSYTFAFPEAKEYFTVMGSANFKRSAFVWKANNLLMIREAPEDRPVYDEYKKIFYDVYYKR